jgi:L-threonylcarbamoyladenylate synthase
VRGSVAARALAVTRLSFADAGAWREHVAAAVAHLRAGGLIAYPTETVYGFGCALQEQALARLARLKRNAPDRPFLLLAANARQLPRLRWTPAARRLARAFWPGPLTLVLAGDSPLPAEVVGSGGTVAVRLSPHAGVRALLQALDAPVSSTSANAPGGEPARSADEAAAAIARLGDGEEWLVLDGGVLPPSPPSTLVRCIGGDVSVLRAGAVPEDQVRTVLEEIDVRTS